MVGEAFSGSSPIHIPTTMGNLPDGWQWSHLEGVCNGVFDCPHSTPSLTDSGPFVARSQDIRTGIFRSEQAAKVSEETYEDRIRRAEPKYGDLLYSREGTYFGIAAEVPPESRLCLGQRMVLLRPDTTKVHFRYLRYWLNSSAMARHIHGFRDGTVAERLNLPTIRRLAVPIAPLPVQRAIAHILGTLDDKIALNRRMNATLEAIAWAIFKSWFVDFDPVRARMDGGKPAGMDAATAALFSDRFEETALGCTPQGWLVRPLSDAIEVNPKRTLPKGTISPYLDMKNMPMRGHCPDEIIDRAFSSGTKFCNGDTLLARITPCLENGKSAFVDFLRDDEVGWGSTEYIVFHPRPPLPPEFGYYLARSDDLRSFAIQNMTGTSGRQRVPPDCFHQYLLAVPPEPVAQRFGDLVRPLVRQISASVMQSKTLAAARDALLPRLLSGELDVSQAGKSMKEVL